MAFVGFHAFAGVPEWSDAAAAAATLDRAHALRKRRAAIVAKAGSADAGAKLTRTHLVTAFQGACKTEHASMMSRVGFDALWKALGLPLTTCPTAEDPWPAPCTLPTAVWALLDTKQRGYILLADFVAFGRDALAVPLAPCLASMATQAFADPGYTVGGPEGCGGPGSRSALATPGVPLPWRLQQPGAGQPAAATTTATATQPLVLQLASLFVELILGSSRMEAGAAAVAAPSTGVTSVVDAPGRGHQLRHGVCHLQQGGRPEQRGPASALQHMKAEILKRGLVAWINRAPKEGSPRDLGTHLRSAPSTETVEDTRVWRTLVAQGRRRLATAGEVTGHCDALPTTRPLLTRAPASTSPSTTSVARTGPWLLQPQQQCRRPSTDSIASSASSAHAVADRRGAPAVDLAVLTARAHAIAASHHADVDSLGAVVQELQAALQDMGASCGAVRFAKPGRGRRESSGSTASSVSIGSAPGLGEVPCVGSAVDVKGRVRCPEVVALAGAALEGPCVVVHCPAPECAPPTQVQLW